MTLKLEMKSSRTTSGITTIYAKRADATSVGTKARAKVLLTVLMIILVLLPISSGVTISIATNSACNYNDSSSNSVVVHNSSVNLTCCVEEFPCPGLTTSWYRNGSDEEISRDKVLYVNLTEPKETFICVADNVIPYPNCYENQYNATVTLIQGRCTDEAPVKFIKTPAKNSYALVGHKKVLTFRFGRCVKVFVLVGSTHLADIHYINGTYKHYINPESGIEDYNITLWNVRHIYSNNYTVYASTNGNFSKTDERYSFFLRVCDKPQWYSNQSTAKHNSSTHTATLQYTFKACYSPDDELFRVFWKRNEKPLNVSDERYNVSHICNHSSNYSLCIYTLMIHHTTINDSGNYSCHLWYKKSKIDYSVMEKGIEYLNITGSESKSADSTDWQMLGGLIGGGVFLLIILAGLIVIFQYKPAPAPGPLGEPLLVRQVQEHELPDRENSEPVFTTPQQPESSKDESMELPISLQMQSLPHSPRLPPPSLKPRTKVEQRLVYHRKDIVELLAGREKSEVVAYFNKRNILRKDQLDHFFYLDEPLQAYTYLFDAIITAGNVAIEKFQRYLLDSDVSDYFYSLVAPKVFLFYVMTNGGLEENIRQFAVLLRQCGINVVCDFFGTGDSANGHLWVQQKINDCISSGGYVLVDVTNGPMNDLSHTQDANPTLNMRYTHFDSKTLYQNVIGSRECFIPFCLDSPPPSMVFPFEKDLVYHINITKFHQSFLEFKDTKYLDEFNVSEDQAVRGFINEASDQFKPIVDLISRLTSQQHYLTE